MSHLDDPWIYTPVVDLYFYAATVIDRFPNRVGDGTADGDSMTVVFDYGRNLVDQAVGVRLYAVDTSELRDGSHSKYWRKLYEGDDPVCTVEQVNAWADVAEDYLDQVCPDGSDVLLRTERDDEGKYGRLISNVYVPVERLDVLHAGLPERHRPIEALERLPLTAHLVTYEGSTWANINADLVMRGLAVPAWT